MSDYLGATEGELLSVSAGRRFPGYPRWLGHKSIEGTNQINRVVIARQLLS